MEAEGGCGKSKEADRQAKEELGRAASIRVVRWREHLNGCQLPLYISYNANYVPLNELT